MPDKEVNASRFKAECLGMLDQVAETGQPLLVTKRGKPVARVLPVRSPAPLRGSVEFKVDDDQLVQPLGETWDAAV